MNRAGVQWPPDPPLPAEFRVDFPKRRRAAVFVQCFEMAVDKCAAALVASAALAMLWGWYADAFPNMAKGLEFALE